MVCATRERSRDGGTDENEREELRRVGKAGSAEGGEAEVTEGAERLCEAAAKKQTSGKERRKARRGRSSSS